jgi:hypothetical protein
MAKSQVRASSQSVRHLVKKTKALTPVGSMPLNFKVPSDFRREFKTYAAQHNKKLNQLLYEAFAALKAKND